MRDLPVFLTSPTCGKGRKGGRDEGMEEGKGGGSKGRKEGRREEGGSRECVERWGEGGR